MMGETGMHEEEIEEIQNPVGFGPTIYGFQTIISTVFIS